MSGTVEYVTSPDGTRIAFRRVGSGPALLAIHGGLGSWRSWKQVAERLADRFEVLLYDRRGRGDSDFGTEPHTLEREVEDALALLEVAGSGAGLLGHSFGGALALELALAVPSRVTRLAVYEPAAGVGDVIGPAEIATMERLLDDGELLASVELGFQALADAKFMQRAGPLAGRPYAERAALAELAPTVPRELAAAASLGTDLGRYRALRVPTLVLAGGASPARMRRGCAALAEALPAGELVELPEVAHVAHATAPDLVADHVRAFLG